MSETKITRGNEFWMNSSFILLPFSTQDLTDMKVQITDIVVRRERFLQFLKFLQSVSFSNCLPLRSSSVLRYFLIRLQWSIATRSSLTGPPEIYTGTNPGSPFSLDIWPAWCGIGCRQDELFSSYISWVHFIFYWVWLSRDSYHAIITYINLCYLTYLFNRLIHC